MPFKSLLLWSLNLLLLLAILGLFLSHRLAPPAQHPRAPAAATAQPNPRQPPRARDTFNPGSLCTVDSESAMLQMEGQVLGAVDYLYLDALKQALLVQDEYGAAEVLTSGEIVRLTPGVKCRYITNGLVYRRVRILDGGDAGTLLWVDRDAVVPFRSIDDLDRPLVGERAEQRARLRQMIAKAEGETDQNGGETEPADPAVTPEEKARRKLHLALRLREGKNPSSSHRWLREIIVEFPETAAARDAAALLDRETSEK